MYKYTTSYIYLYISISIYVTESDNSLRHVVNDVCSASSLFEDKVKI